MTDVLVLGGTAEAREVAQRLTAAGPAVVVSLAGRTAVTPRTALRTGGFGGAEGLARHLTDERVRLVVDATHPFAARMTANAATACAATGVPLVVLQRPAWSAGPGDDWLDVPDLASAATVLGDPGRRVLLTVGRDSVAPFAGCPHRFWLRSVRPPDGPRPARCELLLARGPFGLDDERNLLRELRIDLLVSKNSGGPAAKLTAARELGVPVVLVRRPPLPPGVDVVVTAAAATERALRALA